MPQLKSAMNESISALSSQDQVVNSEVSDDQTGTRSLKRSVDEPAILDTGDRTKTPWNGRENRNRREREVKTIVLDSEFSFPIPRWEASEELSTFLGTTNKRMNKFERKALVRSYLRPDVDPVYTPDMGEFLKPFVQGIIAPDKPLIDVQDNILDLFGPVCTMYENLLDGIAGDGITQLDKPSIYSFLFGVKHALLLLGDASAWCGIDRRELVQKKINSLMISMVQENFPDTKRHLFGPGFERMLKVRLKTAETIAKASIVATTG